MWFIYAVAISSGHLYGYVLAARDYLTAGYYVDPVVVADARSRCTVGEAPAYCRAGPGLPVVGVGHLGPDQEEVIYLTAPDHTPVEIDGIV